MKRILQLCGLSVLLDFTQKAVDLPSKHTISHLGWHSQCQKPLENLPVRDYGSYSLTLFFHRASLRNQTADILSHLTTSRDDTETLEAKIAVMNIFDRKKP